MSSDDGLSELEIALLKKNIRRSTGMVYNTVKCEAVKVDTDSGICPGVAKTELGETLIIKPSAYWPL